MRVGLVHIATHFQQILQEFPTAVARGIVEPTVAGTVHGIGVGPTVQQQLHHCDAVGSDGIAQRCDTLVVLAQWLVNEAFGAQDTPNTKPS